MKITYDTEEDILYVRVTDKDDVETADFNFAIIGNRVEISIGNAQRFITQARAALPKISQPKSSELVWHNADSSMISAFAYDEEEQILHVAFNRTGVYLYYDVPPDVVTALQKASSKGSYMRSMIIGMYADAQK